MFEKLQQFNIADKTAKFDLHEMGPEARLIVKPATSANVEYHNNMMAMGGARLRRLAQADTISAEDAQKSRDEDRQLFPRFVIIGWENIPGDPNGEEADVLDENGHCPFRRKYALQLCQQLPDHIFDRLRNFAATPRNFYPEGAVDLPDIDELAGN